MEGLDRFGRFVNRRELRAVASRLAEGERVLALAEATLDRKGVLAATDKRLLFVRVRLFGAAERSWPHRDVVRLSRKTDVDDASLELRTTTGVVHFTGLRKDDARDFADAVAKRPLAAGEPVDFALPPGEAERRKRLERLDRMMARGSLTRAEYERSKAAIAAEAEQS